MSTAVTYDGRTLPFKRFTTTKASGSCNSELGLKRGKNIYAFDRDTVYQLDDSLYQTDIYCARVKYAWCPLKLKTMPRGTYLQGRIGKLVNRHGDVGGHLQACSLGGSRAGINLIPQNEKVNGKGGAWYKMEDDARGHLRNGLSVELVVQLNYSNRTTLRPSSFSVWLVCFDHDKTSSTHYYYITN
jgi:hypothetical protein